MKRTFLILLFFFCSVQSFSQYEFEFSGYAVELPVDQISNKEIAKLLNFNRNQFLNLIRLRLRPTYHLWTDARIAAEYEIASLYYNGTGLLNILMNETNRQFFDWTWNLVSENKFIINHFIDRLYFRQGFDYGNFILGRQRIAWGTGRIWNPTDLFNPINPAAFYKTEKDGADAATATVSFGNFTDLELVYNPQKKFKSENYGFRFRTNFFEYDFALVGAYFDKRVIIGGDFAGNFFEAGVRGEGIISADRYDLSSNFIKFILGMDYQFTSKLYGLIEYQYNGEGFANKNQYQLLRLLNGEILNLSRNYIFLQSTYQLHPLITTALSLNSNLNDGSGFAAASVSYNALENLYVNLGAQITYGNQFDEYWYYPSSVYLSGEFYF
jgi:hypothetical protein